MAHRPWPVILLPGGILPARPAYEALLGELGDDVDARTKDLEMYASETVPPPGYTLETEVEGILRTAPTPVSRRSTSSGTPRAVRHQLPSPRAIRSDFAVSR